MWKPVLLTTAAMALFQLAPGVPVRAQTAAAERPEADELLDMVREMHDRLANVGYQIHISQRGETVLDAQIGDARLEDSVPVRADTRFLIMSVTKAFTGAALVKAASAGLVDLDAPLSKYLPDYPHADDPGMTLRALAAHTAGVPHFRHPDRKALYVEHFTTATQAIGPILQQPLTHAPGTAYAYSSGNYNLIAAALESVSGQSFSEFLKETVLTPLGLENTEHLDVQRPTSRLARNYSLHDLWDYADLKEPQLVPTWDFSFNPGGGGMISTARDLVRFGEAFLAPGFFTEKELELFYTPILTQPESPWSFGWFVGTTESGAPRLRISGATPGVMASVYVLPEEGVVASAITNSWSREARAGELIFAGVERILAAHRKRRVP